MSVTFSVPPALAYGAGEGLPYIDRAQEVAQAAYHLAHGYPGGIAPLAVRMVVSPNTLTHKVNPRNTTHHLTLVEAVAMQMVAGNASILHSMAAVLGYVVHRATPDQAGGCPVQALVRANAEWADLLRAVGDPLEAGADAVPTPNALRRVGYHAQEAHAAIDHMVAALRGRMRPEPAREVAP
ncbi:phage regulatory CII family protein [Paracidovorax wautersii]|uniref:phage regulatory CII family protein n=1 Tax=Paracidovorax wautersii TaxID=1177982 RepID=UPI0031D7F628